VWGVVRPSLGLGLCTRRRGPLHTTDEDRQRIQSAAKHIRCGFVCGYRKIVGPFRSERSASAAQPGVHGPDSRDEKASGDGVYALNQSDGTVVFGDGSRGVVPPRVQSNVEPSYKVGDGMETVTCHCGAIYETIETKGTTKDQSPSTRTNVQFRLRQQPQLDRE
jgi:hypothetical protein